MPRRPLRRPGCRRSAGASPRRRPRRSPVGHRNRDPGKASLVVRLDRGEVRRSGSQRASAAGARCRVGLPGTRRSRRRRSRPGSSPDCGNSSRERGEALLRGEPVGQGADAREPRVQVEDRNRRCEEQRPPATSRLRTGRRITRFTRPTRSVPRRPRLRRCLPTIGMRSELTRSPSRLSTRRE